MKISRGVLSLQGILWFICFTLIAACGDDQAGDFQCKSGATTVYVDIEGPGYISSSEMQIICDNIIGFL